MPPNAPHLASEVSLNCTFNAVYLFFGVQELCALYCLADVLVITPIRDGMNISPFEYVVSREAHGLIASVVLSEFAGCARSLGGALLVNPWNTHEVTEQMMKALALLMSGNDNFVAITSVR